MLKSNHPATLFVVTLAILVFAGTHGARATPQLLALVSTGSPVDLNCNGRTCSAEFSAFCLQPERDLPTQGTAYRLAAGSDVALIGITRAGDQIPLSAARYLAIESARAHFAVRIAMSRVEMDALGIIKVAVTVGEFASLLPVPLADGPNSRSPEEIAVVTGPWRRLGATLVDGNDDHMVVARITQRMINGLDGLGSPDRDARRSLWRDALRVVAPAGISELTEKFARDVVGFCEFITDQSVPFSLRACLQARHDGLMNFLNVDYWKVVRTGL